MQEYSFKAVIEIIGVNPYVFVPEPILAQLMQEAGKSKGPIPIKGFLNKKPYTQTLVKFSGAWRLYINTTMLKNSPRRVGETIEISVAYDPASRAFEAPAGFVLALKNNPKAQKIFEQLSPSRKNEIVRYLARLKSEEILQKNIEKAIQFLLGNARFVGRQKP